MKNTQLRLPHIRIPTGSVLRIPHGGKPELRCLSTVSKTQAVDDKEHRAQRQVLLSKAHRLGITDPHSAIEDWSNEHLEGAIFERTCTWIAARRAGVRGINRRWSDHAFFVAMVKAKRFGNSNQHHS